MNHRELLLSASRKAKFAFLSLPEDLQDEVIDSLDRRTLTLRDAAELVKVRGYSLSFVAISGYYRVLRMERRLQEVRHDLSRLIAGFAQKPHEEILECLANLAIAIAANGLANGSTKFKEVDLPALLKVLLKEPPTTPAAIQRDEQNQANEPAARLGQELAEEIRKKVLGIR